MNKVVQRVASLPVITIGASVRIPLGLSNNEAAKLRVIEFALRGAAVPDILLLMALHKRPFENSPSSLVEVYEDPGVIARWGFTHQITTTGSSSVMGVGRYDVGDLDYQLVLAPTVIGISVGQSATVVCGLYFEIVKVSDDEWNAIAAWQGGHVL